MKMKTHSVYIRMMSLLLAVLCIVGLFPASALAASPNTIKLEDCTYNGVHYDSPALGICYMHQMQFDFNGDSVMGFCSEKGKGMGWSLEGHEWNSPKEINDSTVKIMMAYFYCHTKGIFTDRAQALGLDEVWGSDYTWTMNAWVQAVVWRYKAGLLSDPVVACAEELMYVFNNLKHTNYTSIDEELDGWSFRDRAQYTLDLGAEGVWGDCAVYEYKYAGPGSNYHPANDVQAVFVGELTITREQYELTVKKVDSTNPSKGLSGARFLIQSANGTYSKEVVTGSDGTYTLSPLDAGTYSVTEMAPPEGYEIDNAGPQYVVLPNESGTTVTVTFTDTPVITSEGSIRKVDSDDPSKGLAGAVIKIEGVDNSFTGTYTTGVGGYLQDVPWDTMPIGSYVATEVTPPNGYTISKDPDKVRQEFYWDGKSDVDLVFENDAKVKLELLKVNDSDQPIEGAVFNVLKDGQIIVNVAKGIEDVTYKTLSDIIEEEIPNAEVCVLSGPSHAEEVGIGIPTTVVIGAKNKKTAEMLQDVFMNKVFRVYTSSDIIGIELGGALKNVIALAAGTVDGLGYGDNTKAALMTRGIAELTRLGEAMGGKPETFSGLTGVGDLIVTCTSVHSRNRKAGYLMGKGMTADEAMKEVKMVVEGVYSAKAALGLAKKCNVSVPIVEAVNRVLFENADPKEEVSNLLLREKKQEHTNLEWD